MMVASLLREAPLVVGRIRRKETAGDSDSGNVTQIVMAYPLQEAHFDRWKEIVSDYSSRNATNTSGIDA